jgi:uncharacterized protein YhaN
MPKFGIELLEKRRKMFGDFDRRLEILDECGRLEEKIRGFENRIRAAAEKHGVDSEDPSHVERELWKMLQDSKKGRDQFEILRGQKEDLAERLEKARKTLSRTREEFDACLEKAGLPDESGLDGFLERFLERSKLREKLEEVRGGLAEAARTEKVEDFIERVRQVDSSGIEVELVRIDERLGKLKEMLAEAEEERRDCLRRRKSLEDIRDEAARQEQEAEFALARMREDAGRFVRLRMAISLLRGRIEEFRRRNQGPFMEAAGRWFAELTGHSFSGIAPDYGNGDKPVIVGTRAGNNKMVGISGMSEGTRDQLYLALRLAGLEFHLKDHEPMPMILDDLLVHFDDDRAGHALAALSRLASKSQVLLFTHHAHLVELAREHLGDGGFRLAELR